jgi:uncharacterized protein (TIGR04168 family)
MGEHSASRDSHDRAGQGAEVRIGIVGDVHDCWGDDDARWFDQAGYDLMLFVGDLASYLRDGRAVARSIATMSTPALVLPGNHDGVSLPQLAAEALGTEALCHWFGRGQARRCRAFERALGPVPCAGYSAHPFEVRGLAWTVIAARPHSMGGRRLSFRRYLEQRFGVPSLTQSAERLEALVAESETEQLLFLAHNGPTGLGAKPDDIWGCDFRPELGDFGDEDLRRAVDHARERRKRVIAVVAGHMHHAVKGGGERCWLVERDGVPYVNAARVPRIVRRAGRRERHHVLLRTDGARTLVEQVWVASPLG